MTDSASVLPEVHAWAIPEREYLRQEDRRGRRFAYEHIDPRRTALVVVDMVSFFVDEIPYCRAITGSIERLASSLRSAGGTVAWVLPADGHHDPAWAVEFFGPRIAGVYGATAGQGSLRDRLWRGFEVADQDLLVEKTAASAFFPGRCPLPDLLADRQVDTVIVTGAVTNVCCESTARDAATLGFRVILAADGCATVRDEMHNATLTTIYRSFGDVRPTEDILDLIARA